VTFTPRIACFICEHRLCVHSINASANVN